MKTLTAISATLAATAVFAAAPKTTIPASALAEQRARAVQKQGGEILRKGAFLGKVAVIDTQSRLAFSNAQNVAASFLDQTKMNFVAERAAAGKPADLLKQSKAAVAVVIVDDPDTPLMLLAPEDRWGVVNVAKLVDDLPTEAAKKRFFESRGRKELIRALSILCGGASSYYKGNVMNAATMKEVDKCDERFPVDMITNYGRYMGALGVTPKEMTTYMHACREGWAPNPTNDVQKKIWDKVHELPSNPIKIKYDPKRDK